MTNTRWTDQLALWLRRSWFQRNLVVALQTGMAPGDSLMKLEKIVWVWSCCRLVLACKGKPADEFWNTARICHPGIPASAGRILSLRWITFRQGRTSARPHPNPDV